ncbi:MAG: Na/Pi cotransporter family protein [Clostridia bacterium]|nr:Na/Pi cotransporter family protein [Clostridia bacterium]
MEQAYSIFMLLGGIGLFLFGISYMGAGLEQAAGDNLRIWLEKLTTKPLKAMLVGAGATALIQSSGATMVMAVGFVTAQLMTLQQALYIMLGASIGTTITAQIIAFKINPWAPLILFIGVVLTQFVKKRMVKKVGAIVLGFGVLFEGITLMGDAVKQMDLGDFVGNFLENVNNPLLAILFGFAFTFIIQSSSASVGILQVLVSSGAAFSLGSLVYIIMGMNVGAVAPLVISSLSGNRASRRAAFADVLARVLSVIIFCILLALFPPIITKIESMSPGVVSRQIANFHLLFNLVGAIVLFPFVGIITKVMMKIMPDAEEDEFYARKLLYCTNDLSKSPSVMIAQARKEIFRFGRICGENMDKSFECFFDMDEEKAEGIIEREKTINFLNHELNTYLVSLYAYELPERDIAAIGTMFNVVSDLERIADLAENIAEYTISAINQHAAFSPEGIADLKEMTELVQYMMDTSMRTYETNDMVLLGKAREIEERVDRMEEEKTENHIQRLMREICDPRGGVIYTDMVSDLERISDHAMNIAEGILGINASIEALEVKV